MAVNDEGSRRKPLIPQSTSLRAGPGRELVPAGPPQLQQGRTLSDAQVRQQAANLRVEVPQTPRQRRTAQVAEQLDRSAQRFATGRPGVAQTLATPPPQTPPQPTGPAARAPGAAARAAGKVGAVRSVLGRAALPVAATLEAAGVKTAYDDAGGGAAGVEAAGKQTLKAGGRLAAAAGGAKLGAAGGGALFGPVGAGVGGVLGAIGGYAAGDEAVEALDRKLQRESVFDRLAREDLAPRYDARTNTVRLADGRALGSGRAGSEPMLQAEGMIARRSAQMQADKVPLMRSRLSERDMEVLGAYRAPAGAAPAPAAAAPIQGGASTTEALATPGRVVGTYRLGDGRERVLTETEAQARAAQLPAARGPVAMGPNGSFAFSTDPRLEPGSVARALGSAPSGPATALIGGTDLAEQINEAIKALGPLDRRSKRETMTSLLALAERLQSGDRSAGLQERELEQRRAADLLGAEIDREQIAASERAAREGRQTQTITAEDGTVYALQGTKLTPITGQDGKPLRAPQQKADTSLAVEMARMIGDQLPPNATPEQVQQVAAALGTLPIFQQFAPQGPRVVGYSKDGKPIYGEN